MRQQNPVTHEGAQSESTQLATDGNYVVALEKGPSVVGCFHRQHTRLGVAEVAISTNVSERPRAAVCLP